MPLVPKRTYVNILLLRQNPPSPEVHKLIEEAFGESFALFQSNPRDYLEHAKDCERIKPHFVLLPAERPIPSLAMERGVRHLFVGADGVLHELLGIEVKSRPFAPSPARDGS